MNKQIIKRCVWRKLLLSVCACVCTLSLFAQQKTVTGVITDENGQPMPGATVQIKGGMQGVVSDANGRYAITVSGPTVLVFSFVGYAAQEVVVDGQTAVNIKLREQAMDIEEVVVIGYGTKKKLNLTGAVETVEVKALETRQAPTVSQLLQGLSPAMTLSISGTGGFQPGASMEIDVRGIGSINGGAPYVIVDGMPGDLNGLNPSDVESISVMKDAASSAIYGGKAAYGVIIVTTKKGSKSNKINVTLNTNYIVAMPQNMPSMLDSYTYSRMLNEAGVNGGGPPFSNDHIERMILFQNEDWDALKNTMNWPDGATVFGAYPDIGEIWNGDKDYANNDWFKIWLKDRTFNQKHDLSISGGTEKASYYFSLGYYDQNGMAAFTPDDFTRLNLTGTMQAALTDWMDFSWSTRVNNSARITNFSGTDIYSLNISRSYPFRAVYDGYGNYKHTVNQVRNQGTNNSKTIDTWHHFKLEIRPLKNWRINADFGYNYFTRKHEMPVYLLYNYTVSGNEPVPMAGSTSQVNKSQSDNRYWTSNVYTTYDLKVARLHTLSVMLGSQYEKRLNNQLIGRKADMIYAGVPSLQTATGTQIAEEVLSNEATLGFFSRIMYDYDQKYLFESNMRYDGSYMFRRGNKWGFFPSFSAGWNVHRESFWEAAAPYVNTLKIRASWGQLGNQRAGANLAPYTDLERIPISGGRVSWLFGGNSIYGYSSTPGLVNKRLTWETATTTDLGMDLTFLKSRLSLMMDIYDRTTTNMVGPTEAMPGVLGASPPNSNNATLQTKGFELSVKWQDRLNNGLSYFVQATLSNNKSKVTKYNNPTGTLSTYYEGREIGEIWGYTVHDLFRTQAEVDDYLGNTDLSFIASQWNPGDVRYEDTKIDGRVDNGDNTVDNHGDLSIIGNSEPRYQYGLYFGLSFKGIDFSALFNGVAKRNLYFTSGAMYWGFAATWWDACLIEDHLDYFRDRPGDRYAGLYEGEANINAGAFFPRPYLNATQDNKNRNHANTRYLQDASYLRLQNVQLGYTFPVSLTGKIKIQSIRLYLSGENLLTFSKLPKGVDPVAPLGANRDSYSGLGRFTYGADRMFSFGLTITY
ncbi:MAG: TonB-dependent receptor [Bacteroidales bacterium]|nr:TonB-dependent receptor [Bacteroidales bacterium]